MTLPLHYISNTTTCAAKSMHTKKQQDIYLDSTKHPLLIVDQVTIESVGTACIIISLNSAVVSGERGRVGERGRNRE